MRPLQPVFALLLDLVSIFEYRCPSQGNVAGVAKLVDAPDLGSGILRCGVQVLRPHHQHEMMPFGKPRAGFDG